MPFNFSFNKTWQKNMENAKIVSVTIFGLVLLNGLVPEVYCLSEEMQELIEMLHSSCIEETGVAEDLIVNARKGDFADSEALKCYIKCLMDQMAVIDDDGVVDEDAAIAVLPDEYKAKAEKIIHKCGTKRGSSACETVWLTHQCYQKEDPASYFLP